MLKNLPKNIEDELFKYCKESYERGIEIRRTGVLYSAIFLVVVLVGLMLLSNMSDGLVIAIAVSASSLCIIWSIYSVSASLNMHSDMITRLLIHYSEEGKS